MVVTGAVEVTVLGLCPPIPLVCERLPSARQLLRWLRFTCRVRKTPAATPLAASPRRATALRWCAGFARARGVRFGS